MFIEDIFVKFFKMTISANYKLIPFKDFDVCHSFYNTIREGKALTNSQRTYVLALLSRYKGLSAKVGFDYRGFLTIPEWRDAVRVINKDRTVWVQEENNILYINLKFPFQLKESFDETIEKIYNGRTVWDHENKTRKLKAYNINLFALTEYLEKNGFEIQDSYAELFAEYETIVADSADIIPYATKLNDTIVLVNCAETAQTYWDENKTGIYENDLLLLKFMGIPYVIPNITSKLETIASELTNSFWIPDISEFIKMCYSTTGRIGILLDRSGDTLAWLSTFIEAFNDGGYDSDDIKVCIKEGRHQSQSLNPWLQNNNATGSNKAKFLIFQHKPSKWVFKDNIEFSILGTNAIYQSTNTLTNSWLMSHSCVAYLTDIKPVVAKGQHIVKL